MRIISALMAVWIVLLAFSPEIAQASISHKSNETKTNLKIQMLGVSDSHKLLKNENSHLLAYDPNDFKKNIASQLPKTEEQLKREEALKRFEGKRMATKYPKGKFIINASAYTAAADECGKSDGITASGLMVKERETIACPPQFPFGTKLRIEGMGTYVCQDRGGAIKGNHIDIYMETKKEAFSFGRKNLLAEIVK
jgi:3D (Asp-Asp-Asp) domain-containing protein